MAGGVGGGEGTGLDGGVTTGSGGAGLMSGSAGTSPSSGSGWSSKRASLKASSELSSSSSEVGSRGMSGRWIFGVDSTLGATLIGSGSRLGSVKENTFSIAPSSSSKGPSPLLLPTCSMRGNVKNLGFSCSLRKHTS